jgi:hypothetical protein
MGSAGASANSARTVDVSGQRPKKHGFALRKELLHPERIIGSMLSIKILLSSLTIVHFINAIHSAFALFEQLS